LDRIEIKDLLLRTIVGTKPDERIKKQDVLLNLVLLTDIKPVGASDDISEAVNYRTVTKQIITLVEAAEYYTVEKLATEVARLVVTRFPVIEVTVSVEKPGALRFVRSVGVTITRRPEDFPT
jgi:dihydroneopterin aldolase/D-erythro-7,8-dihydroneopterin triphosphate epimerase